MKERIIYHIEFAKTGLGMSGGETCMVELIKFLVSQKEKNIILTTDNGKQVYENLGLKESEFIEYKIINSFEEEKKHHIFIAYLKRLSKIKKLFKDVFLKEDDIVFCHSDFFPNSIPLFWLYKKNKKVKFFYFFHMIAPNILKGFMGQFIGKYYFPNLPIIHYKLNQILYLKIIKSINSGKIISVNPYYSDFLEKKISKKNIFIHHLKIFGGVDIPELENREKIYDVVWMGRFHKQKGIDELFEISKKLKEKKNDIKILVIGGGTKEAEEDFVKKLNSFYLEKNIDYKGFLNGKERFEIMSQAKIFAMTSYFEGRPIVMLESLKMGLPIVSYDLPVYQVYDKGIIKVPILDNDKFVEKILFLLENSEELAGYSKDAKNFSKDYSWENTGKEIYNLF